MIDGVPSYAHLAGNPKAWEMRRKWQLEFIKAQGLKPHHTLIDYGCGPLCGGEPIIRYLDAGKYLGVDVSKIAMELGARELGDELDFYLYTPDDLSELAIAPFLADYVWAFHSFVHMGPNEFDDALKLIKILMKHDGQMLATINIGCRGDGKWREFPTVFKPWSYYHNWFELNGFTIEDLGTVEYHGFDRGRPRDDHQQHIIRATHKEE